MSIPVIVVTGVYRPTTFVVAGSRSSSQGDAAAALQIVIVQRVLLCRGAKGRIQSDVIIHTYSSRSFWFYIMECRSVKQFIDSGITSKRTPSKRFTKFHKVGRSDQTGALRSCQEQECAGRAESRGEGENDGSRKFDYYSNGVDTDYRYSHSQSPSNDLSRKQSQRCVLKVNHLRHL